MRPGPVIVGMLALGVLVLIGIERVDPTFGLGWIATNIAIYFAGRKEGRDKG